MVAQRPAAVIVVDLGGRNGRCSNCNEKATLDVAHTCGARVTGVALNADLVTRPVRGRLLAINDMCPSGVSCIGTGRIVEGPYGPGFVLTARLTDMA